MDSLPLITVIIPVYNTSSYLHKCLQSVCGQTYTNLEIICVDDGSTDDSLTILREYEAQDSRVRVLQANHGGASAARNLALDAARGEWVIGLDSDDWLEADAYERILRHMRPGIDVVLFSVHPVYEPGEDDARWEKVRKRYLAYYHMDAGDEINMTPELIVNLPVPFWLAMHRRSIIEKYHIRFLEGHIHEDQDFHYHYMCHVQKAAITSEKLYYRLLREDSVMQQPNREQLEDLLPLYTERIYRHFKETGVLDAHAETLCRLLYDKGFWRVKQTSTQQRLRAWSVSVFEAAQRCGMVDDSRFTLFFEQIGYHRATSLNLFGVLPLLRAEEHERKYRFRLFGCLPLPSRKRRPGKKPSCLFSYLVRRKGFSWVCKRDD